MIFYPVWRVILAGFLLKRARWGELIHTAADFQPLRLLAEPLLTALPAPKGKCFMATPAPGQWQWNALQRGSWPGLLLHCVLLCPQECADLANDNTERALSPALPLCWLFSKLEWLHWLSLHYPQGEARRQAGGRKIAFLMAFIPAGFEFSYQ